MIDDRDRFEATIKAIDQANSEDPHVVLVGERRLARNCYTVSE